MDDRVIDYLLCLWNFYLSMDVFLPNLRTALLLNNLHRILRVSYTLVQAMSSQSISFKFLSISLVIVRNLLDRKERGSLMTVIIVAASWTHISQSVTNRTLIVFGLSQRTANMNVLFALLQSVMAVVDFLFLTDR